ncbi:hypothetical protein MML48_9g00009813 [Holotrichia oblita]|uniref:Uncharacterized protein n=1 Tax=Holotrichia oblita TaxID=644536 RepID=A0ACB9SIS1_HOLOL|nr:hypothetical protein MML48_9g00009813 [Holotrichia oblita]
MDNNITIERSPRGKGRKRIANKEEWKREKAKSKRYSRQHLPEFPTCGHRTKTMQCCLLTMTEIRKFNEGFYQKENKLFQDMFVLKHCVTSKPKRPGTKIKENVRNKPKAISVKYNIKTSKGTIPVCKKTFVAILGIGKNRLERIVSRYHQTGGLPAENRGGDQISHKTAAKSVFSETFLYDNTILALDLRRLMYVQNACSFRKN